LIASIVLVILWARRPRRCPGRGVIDPGKGPDRDPVVDSQTVNSDMSISLLISRTLK
jgi:hypothetical protein